jgi:hypothetical protein
MVDDWLGRFYTGIISKLRPQLFLCPRELLPLLQLTPEPSLDAVVLFVAKKRDKHSGSIARNVVPSSPSPGRARRARSHPSVT